MAGLQSLSNFAIIGLALARLGAGAIGPVADLTLADADISPDGYTRAAIVMNDQFPGPLITGNKVRMHICYSLYFNGRLTPL